jgi:hypothetical protein
MNNSKSEFPSLITSDPKTGMALAAQLASQLQAQFEQANALTDRPGGTNYALPSQVPKEVIGSVLFYAISAANHGWSQTRSSGQDQAA